MSASTAQIAFSRPQIEMAHGAGGKASRRLVEGLFAPLLLRRLGGSRWATPRTSASTAPTSPSPPTASSSSRCGFPGGSIGELAVNGTVNDLAVSGARAEALVVTYVIEAGLPTRGSRSEVRAMADAAARAGVPDRRRRHQSRGAWQGRRYVHHDRRHRPPDPGVQLSSASRCVPATGCILSGPIGDHGITILLARGELDIEADLRSDTRSVLPLVEALAAAAAPGLRWMRDPTRGGVATSLNELARDCRLGRLSRGGTDPGARCRSRRLRTAGWIRCTSPTKVNSWRWWRRRYADRALRAARGRRAAQAAIIGEVRGQPAGTVLATTAMEARA